MLSKLIVKLGFYFSLRSRAKRAEIFKKHLNPSTTQRILDLGGGSGFYLATILPNHKNIYVADNNKELLNISKRYFGFKTIFLNVNEILPFKDKYFDIIFCNSLIEHATGDKKQVLKYKSNVNFSNAALKYQFLLADEIRRVGKKYFVETPYKYFPLESHTWLPMLIIFLPRRIQIEIINLSNKWWPKKTFPDWNLLTIQQMKDLFPESKIITEKFLGFTKSIIAIKTDS